MRVFISHSSQDKPAVETLAAALTARKIDVWLDKAEIGPGDDIVRQINQGLEGADAGIIVFSRHSRESRWVDAEASYLTYARIQEQKIIVPVMIGDDSYVPPLLRPLARRRIDEVEAIVQALLHPEATPAPAGPAGHGSVERVLVALRQNGPGIASEVRIGGKTYGQQTYPALPSALAAAHETFLKGFRHGLRRDAAAAERHAQEAHMAALGRALAEFCLPGDAGAAVANLVDGCPVGTTVEICCKADDPTLLGLPFEAMLLPDGRLLALQPPVVMMRRPAGLAPAPADLLAGPLKILVAVGAPDEGASGGAVLDQERELQNILDAVETARHDENCDVRILEVGHPDVIGAAIASDAYHVLHLSCHGLPGALELEDEEGRAVRVTAAELLAPLLQAGRPLPLILLNSCYGGVPAAQTASLAEALLRGGIPAVVAMQAPVSDFYATKLAESFYRHLARRRDSPLASRALADARKEQERARLAAAAHGAPLSQTQPEYATAALYVAGEEQPFADFARTRQPLGSRPVYDVPGPVPQLRLDDLIGRRRELREALRTLRDRKRQYAGIVLTGIGGVGKSAVAGRMMNRLAGDGWLVPAHRGRFDLTAIAVTLGSALVQTGRAPARRLGEMLMRTDLDDRLRLQLLGQALTGERVLLVLDDFEQNLPTGGGAFLDDSVAEHLRLLAESARTGRVLITCRHPVPGTEAWLRPIAVGPLSPAESRKLLLRLPGLAARDAAGLAGILRIIGGHPRMLEFLDGLLRGGEGRLPAVTAKLRGIAGTLNLDLTAPTPEIDNAVETALAIGARDVFLEELLAIARRDGSEEILLQAAVSNLPVTPEGLARMLADDGPGDPAPVVIAIGKLEALSLLHRLPEGTVWVHRWTAEGLANLGDEEQHHARCLRAGRYRWWRVENEGGRFDDGIEALRSFLAGRDFDDAVGVGESCIEALRRWQQSVGIAVLAAEILETLPETHPGYASIADEEAQAHLALGLTDRALMRYRQLLGRYERHVEAEPDRADYQRDLSVCYSKMGDLYGALGQGDEARQAYLKSLAIAERLAQAEPDRADHQRDLSVSYNKMGDLYGALGQSDEARQAYLKALAIRERLAQAEPDRADYQRDLAASYSRMGDLYGALGQGEEARQAYLKALAIAERLAQAEPERADYQRDLSVSCNKMGDLYGALGQGDEARQAYLKALAIRERLAQAEPDRADYQRDLSVSYERMGDLFRALGQGEEARQAFLKSLAIAERLAQAEPDRADYQRDLSVSYERMGDLYRALGQGDEAQQAYLKALAIRERLAQAEPNRADYQRDLSVSYNRMGDLYRALGQGDEARQAYLKDLAIAERLAQAEPDRADYQHDLSVSYNKIGDLYAALGQSDEARQAYLKALAIRERLAQAEPDRADYQRDLSVSYNNMGDIYAALGQGDEARQAYLKALAIVERLAQAEPERADYQRDLSVSYNNMGDIYAALDQGDEARQAYLKALAIVERLAQAEPERADYQRDLIVSCVKISENVPSEARARLSQALVIARDLEAQGRLAPVDAWMLDDLAQHLAGLPTNSVER